MLSCHILTGLTVWGLNFMFSHTNTHAHTLVCPRPCTTFTECPGHIPAVLQTHCTHLYSFLAVSWPFSSKKELSIRYMAVSKITSLSMLCIYFFIMDTWAICVTHPNEHYFEFGFWHIWGTNVTQWSCMGRICKQAWQFITLITPYRITPQCNWDASPVVEHGRTCFKLQQEVFWQCLMKLHYWGLFDERRSRKIPSVLCLCGLPKQCKC